MIDISKFAADSEVLALKHKSLLSEIEQQPTVLYRHVRGKKGMDGRFAPYFLPSGEPALLAIEQVEKMEGEVAF
jgi:hypothetical protein